jgi:hypothetical protein
MTSLPEGVPSDPGSVEELSRELYDLPIGIFYLVALMRARRIPIKSVLGHHRRNKLGYRKKEVSEIITRTPMIATNWSVSFKASTNQAKSLLGILSLPSSDEIHWELLNIKVNAPLVELMVFFFIVISSTTGRLPFINISVLFGTTVLADYSLCQVEETLTNLSLVDKDPRAEILHVQRLAQVEINHEYSNGRDVCQYGWQFKQYIGSIVAC